MSKANYNQNDPQLLATMDATQSICSLFELLACGASLTDGGKYAEVEADLKAGQCWIRAEANLDTDGLIDFTFSAIREKQPPQTIFVLKPKRH